jgi:hypothetical protein
MANIITAGNSTNGGTQIVTDTSGTLDIKTGSGSGVIAMSIDASGNVSGVLKSGTAVTSNSGTSIDFTGIPSTAKRITVMLNSVSTNGTSIPQIQLGTSSGITTTGYTGHAAAINAGTGQASSTSGHIISNGSSSAASYAGHIVFTNITGNNWIGSAVTLNGAAAGAMSMSASLVGLAATLDRVRITTVNGTDTFDSGSINILYE